MKKTFRFLVVLIFVVIAGEIVREAIYFFSPNSTDDAYKIILIEPGSFYKNADLLAQEGIVKNPRRFARIVRVLRLRI